MVKVYRPISWLSNNDKTLERLLYHRLYNILEEKIIFSLQFNFRQKYSTTHALMRLIKATMPVESL